MSAAKRRPRDPDGLAPETERAHAHAWRAHVEALSARLRAPLPQQPSHDVDAWVSELQFVPGDTNANRYFVASLLYVCVRKNGARQWVLNLRRKMHGLTAIEHKKIGEWPDMDFCAALAARDAAVAAQEASKGGAA